MFGHDFALASKRFLKTWIVISLEPLDLLPTLVLATTVSVTMLITGLFSVAAGAYWGLAGLIFGARPLPTASRPRSLIYLAAAVPLVFAVGDTRFFRLNSIVLPVVPWAVAGLISGSREVHLPTRPKSLLWLSASFFLAYFLAVFF